MILVATPLASGATVFEEAGGLKNSLKSIITFKSENRIAYKLYRTWSKPKIENQIGSVVIDILSFRPKILTTLFYT